MALLPWWIPSVSRVGLTMGVGSGVSVGSGVGVVSNEG